MRRQIDVELGDLVSHLMVQCFVVDRDGVFRVTAGGDGNASGATTVFEAYGSEPHAVAALERLLAGHEVTFRAKRGHVAYEVRAQPLRDEHGKPDGAMGVATIAAGPGDPAKARQRRDAEAAAQLRHAVAHAPFILWSVDRDGVFTLSEGQGLVAIGRKPGEAVGQSAFELYGDLPGVERAIRRGLAGEAFSYVTSVRGRIFETRTFPTRDLDGNIAGFSAVSLDVTERQRAEADRAKMQAQQLEGQRLESLGLLAGGIAHDFNNILTVILSSAQSATLRLPAHSPAREDIDNVTIAARRAAALTHQMLAYSGRARFEIRELDLSGHVREIATLLEVTVSKKAQLRLQIAPALPTIWADTAQIQQVVMNLVLNAAEAIGDRTGTVLVTTGVQQIDAASAEVWSSSESPSPGEYVFVEVRDTGVGMDAATRARIFDPFFTTKATGRGLGLSAVLGVVRAHRGAIHVDSTPGAGSTIRVIFPSSGQRASAAAPLPSMYRGEGLALLIDDDPSVRRAVRDMLAQLGFSVIEAANGREGVALYREQASGIAVVIVDMTMPEMGGEETFREIRASSDVPVILMSGYAEVDPSARSATQSAFLHKPFTRAELSQTLRLILQEAGAQEAGPLDTGIAP